MSTEPAELDAVYLPQLTVLEGASEPVWRTWFGLSMPEGHWERGDGYAGRPSGELEVAEGLETPGLLLIAGPASGWRITTDRGLVVAGPGGPVVVFNPEDSRVVGTSCVIPAGTAGGFDHLADSYTVTSPAGLSATFTAAEFFEGQGEGSVRLVAKLLVRKPS